METTKTNFDCFNPDSNEYPVIFSLPHSGTIIPDNIKPLLRKDVKLPNTDWFLKELYDFIPKLGFTTLQNNINRYVADPNRKNFDISENGDYRHNVIYQQNTFGHPLYYEPLDKQQIDQRISEYYQPYHDKLQQLIDNKLKQFDEIYLIDLHSFAYYPGFEMMSPADFVVGNDYDNTSSEHIKNWLTNELIKKHYTVSDNFPFTGGHITKHYGSNDNVHTLQVEARYNIYIDKRDFDEEELTTYNTELFNNAQENLKRITELFKAKMR
ncbi:N-formylglutamate amidohydrolase [Companilactobacillus jidongensis]|uniref:N-formylglutamate amidohydrolase n=1 Tax=Companilactobacillus jidongensis TaxID=2486006 RepID=UPI000F786AB9|nr:N-formylglutamate amidohydrolase [Companilactobacillus jidongensis]